VNHAPAQVLGGGLFLRLANGDFVSCSVLFDNPAVVDGNLRGAIIEIGGRIASSRHHGSQELIRFHERTGRIVHEFRLDRAPRLLKPVAICRGKRPQVITLYPLFNLLELILSLEFISGFGQGAVIFRPEAGAKFLGAILQDENCGHSDYSNHHNYKNCDLR
jgi:hypothetical protein